MLYSVSFMYSRRTFKHAGKFADLGYVMQKYNEMLNRWKNDILNGQYAACVNDFCGMRIKDENKNIIFEEKHFSEELGYKKEIETIMVDGNERWHYKWVKTLDKQK